MSRAESAETGVCVPQAQAATLLLCEVGRAGVLGLFWESCVTHMRVYQRAPAFVLPALGNSAEEVGRVSPNKNGLSSPLAASERQSHKVTMYCHTCGWQLSLSHRRPSGLPQPQAVASLEQASCCKPSLAPATHDDKQISLKHRQAIRMALYSPMETNALPFSTRDHLGISHFRPLISPRDSRQ